MVRRTPNGFEQFMTWLHKMFLLFCTLAVSDRVILYQNVLEIVIKSIREISDSSKPHAYFKDKSFESII